MFNSVWYDNLIKPLMTPPSWVFAPVWIILYSCLLIALIIYSVTFTLNKKLQGYILFVIHMIFNVLWSPIFFQLQKPDIALAVLVIMLITALLFIKKFYSVSKLSGIILIPYLIWIFFAAYLNVGIVMLN